MLTPGEITKNMYFTVLEGKPAAEQDDIWKESQPEFSFGFVFGGSSRPDPIFGIAHCYKVVAINLPFVITIDVVTKKGAVFDCRNVILKEVDESFVKIFVKTFKPKISKKKK